MYNLGRRLDKIEKKLCIGEKPHPVIIAGMEMASDEFAELLKEIDGTSKGKLPCEEEIREYRARATKSNQKQLKAEKLEQAR